MTLSRRLRAARAALLLAAASACAGGGENLGRHVAHPRFDAELGWSFLTAQTAFGPRYAGTPSHDRQLAWMREELAARADIVLLQPFPHTGKDGRTVMMTNVFARFRPEARDRILLLAHWDTRPTADRSPHPADRTLPVPGANDGASGVAVLMAVAQALHEQAPPVGVDLLFTDGEDYGAGDLYAGAKHFVAQLPAGYRPAFAVELDMVGDRDARFPREANSRKAAPRVLRRVWGIAREMGKDSVFVDAKIPDINDDHMRLNEIGIPSILVIDPDYGPGNAWWHTVDDLPDKVSRSTLGVVGDVITEVVYRGVPGKGKGGGR